MRVANVPFRGFFEEQPVETAENLQMMAAEDRLERELLAWTILPHGEVVEDDEARRDYVFRYTLARGLSDHLWALRIEGRDRAGRTHTAELAAGLLVTAGSEEGGAVASFAPFWLLSDSLYFRWIGPGVEPHRRPAFGHLRFGRSENLPHRRLFGAAVPSA